jgi:hypothetical protein
VDDVVPLARELQMAAAWESPSQFERIGQLGAGRFPVLFAFDEDDWAGRRQRISLYDRCELNTATPARFAAGSGATAKSVSGFGERLAEAAAQQLSDFVVYDDAYRSIAYPAGDVPALYGVCTDVVIRAYRALGIDLQVAVQKARVGSGDRNIDHRRTETLRQFFAKAGETLPVTSFAEDYLPGDIVTYARPQNTGSASRSHIAMVSGVIGPSGRPMIIHNRGWGPQLEDGLFVDRITGHYRYAGTAAPRAATADASRAATSAAVSTVPSTSLRFRRGLRAMPDGARAQRLSKPPRAHRVARSTGRATAAR